MSSDELHQVVAHTRFEFIKLAKGKRVVKAGEVCHHLYLLTNGSLTAETVSPDGAYRVEEDIQPPYIIQPERFAGISQRHTATFTTSSESHIIAINKREATLLTERFTVFRMNMIGMFASRTQTLIDDEWSAPPPSLRAAIVRFLRHHSMTQDGTKRFHILMNRLAQEVNDSRLNVSRTLNGMQKEGLIQLNRGCITVFEMKNL